MLNSPNNSPTSKTRDAWLSSKLPNYSATLQRLGRYRHVRDQLSTISSHKARPTTILVHSFTTLQSSGVGNAIPFYATTDTADHPDSTSLPMTISKTSRFQLQKLTRTHPRFGRNPLRDSIDIPTTAYDRNQHGPQPFRLGAFGKPLAKILLRTRSGIRVDFLNNTMITVRLRT